MNLQRDFSGIVRSWLREDQHESADQLLDVVLSRLDTTPQRRSWWPAWRSDSMNTYAKLIAAAAAVLVVAFVGYQFLPGRAGPGGPTTVPSPTAAPTAAPSPTAAPTPTTSPTTAPTLGPSGLALGSFQSKGFTIDIDATGEGSNVHGTMTWSDADVRIVIDLACTRTTPGGLILIGGDVTESSMAEVPQGTRAAIVIQRGSPMRAHPDTEPDPPAATCMDYLARSTDAQQVVDLDPIEGLQLRP